MMRNHELWGQERSGDTADTEHSGAMLKVPSGRRRQMLVMLYCNLFTGPALTLITIILLWLFMPYRRYIFFSYLMWMLFDNYTRKNPSTDRVKQWWRKSRMCVSPHLPPPCLTRSLCT
jgi:hypothetical protein